MRQGQCLGGIMATLGELKSKCGPYYDTPFYAQYDYYPTQGKFGAVDFLKHNGICQNPDRNHCVFKDVWNNS